MKRETQVVVIGGGVVGASVLYHLTKAGWTDVMLLERRELTAGSTWHAAGGMHTLNGDPNVARLQQYTIQLYEEIERVSGQDCSIHLPGGLMLADTEVRMDWLRMAQARGRYLGMELELISAREAADLFPLLDPQYFVGALYDPVEGHVDPTGVTRAYVKCAQLPGAEVHQHTPVVGLEQRPDGTWDVRVESGDTIHTEHVVNAGGLWAREVGRMVGIELPVLAMEHMYLLTEDMPEVAAQVAKTGHEMPMALDFAGEIYIRQEGGAMLLGTYEQACVPWSPRETPWDFGSQLLKPDLERITPELDRRVPPLPGDAHDRHQARRQRAVHVLARRQPARRAGPRAARLLGRVRRDGRAVAGRRRRARPGDLDDRRRPRRQRHGYLGDGRRPLRRLRDARLHQRQGPGELSTPVPDHLPERGAARRAAAADDADPRPADRRERGVGRDLRAGARAVVPASRASSRRRTSPSVAPTPGSVWPRRSAAVREHVGMTEISNYAKYRVTGPGAEAWLSSLLTQRMPAPGRITLTAMLNEAGRIVGEFTVARATDADEYHLFGSLPAEIHHSRWFRHHLPDDGSVRFEVLGLGLTGLSVAGPRSRDVLQSIAPDLDLSTEAFPFMAFRKVDLGMTPVHLARINYAGDLGYELWVTPEYQRELFDRIVAAGEPHGLRLFGMRALMSLRLEKSYGTWFREYRPIYTVPEAGLQRYVRLDHEFIGRAAYEAAGRGRAGPSARGLRRRARSGRPGRCHRRRAGVARRRGRRLDHVGWLRPSRRAVDRAGLRADGAGRGRRRPVRGRDHRPPPTGAHPARAAVRPDRVGRMRA